MTTTAARTFGAIETLTYGEYTAQEHQDIEDGVASAFCIDEFVNNEQSQESFYDEDTDNIPMEWMIDTLNNKYDIVTVKETDLFNNILDLLAVHGYDNVSITVDGKTYN